MNNIEAAIETLTQLTKVDNHYHHIITYLNQKTEDDDQKVLSVLPDLIVTYSTKTYNKTFNTTMNEQTKLETIIDHLEPYYLAALIEWNNPKEMKDLIFFFKVYESCKSRRQII